ncbi:BlaI/MecI/CopY family transcriptional regulator [Paenibacillus sp. OK003]|uniref:BlaI/MecI/CopY family transcriptional regulator n=1 Tax=Paenibacillus sp. OK003 TaxID=1884380 RepID=UPI0008B5F24D|nr:BlaI/MecI/CopY family transcriptional regulator [Paenibacillus sp. OK003]SEK49508.1 BlaI family transcriptional regulator, penicillinase repressor [Paenibacillus sp. OK003]
MVNLGRLSETEMELMEVIWRERTPVTVSKLHEIFEAKYWKKSTVSTLLKRLIEKGFLTKTLDGKVNYYHTTVTLEQYRKSETQTFLNRLYNGKVTNFITALVNDDKFNQQDIAELKEWFRQKKGEE